MAPLLGRRARPRCSEAMPGHGSAGAAGKGGGEAAEPTGPTSGSRAKAAQPTPALPERVRRVRSAPGRRRVSLAVPGVRSTAAGTPRPRLPPRSGRPSRLGSGRACPGMPLASAPALLAPLAGGDVQRRRAARWGQALERRSGDLGILGSTAGTRTSRGVVAPGTLRGAVTIHPNSLSFQHSQPRPWHGDNLHYNAWHRGKG